MKRTSYTGEAVANGTIVIRISKFKYEREKVVQIHQELLYQHEATSQYRRMQLLYELIVLHFNLVYRVVMIRIRVKFTNEETNRSLNILFQGKKGFFNNRNALLFTD